MNDEPTALDHSQIAAVGEAAADFAARAGALVLDRFRSALKVEYKGRGHSDPVTDADRMSERFVHEEIRRHFPDHGVLGEEGSELQSKDAFLWVVDPIDGTTNFVNGLPLWCVSVGVLWHGRPVAGAIYTPSGPTASIAVIRAHRGGGAWLNNEQIHVRNEPEPTQKRLATLPGHYWQDLRFRSRGPNRLGEARTLGSIALELALVACGSLQYGVFWAPKVWDVAAGVALVQEAGGVVLTRSGNHDPWLDLHEFRARPPAKLRDWKASILAGSPTATRVVAQDIGRPSVIRTSLTKASEHFGHARGTP